MSTPSRDGRPRRLSRIVSSGLIRLHELALILVGLGFVFVADDDELAYLAVWDLLAVLYVGIGAVVLRRSRRNPIPIVAAGATTDRLRFNFLFAIVASLIGLTVAVDIAVSDNPDDYAVLLNILGVVAMIMSWMLLQAGYARRYVGMFRRGGGLVFPETPEPSAVDFVYFAVTIGTAFSVSDVLVTTARMRWHVLVHSTISFFYNAAVVAFALSMFAGR
ncbi:DUF1345 domain-containing protein [Nakamurella sp.]|uniref:DUF1345 domain-containing protein n=1 Tax=Nakamurella sp. TaxID=1869182 RepID=UPI003782FF7D